MWNIVVRVIRPGRQVTGKQNEILPDGVDLFGKGAVLSRTGGTQGLFTPGTNHAHDGFRLGQVHFAVEKSTAGEFARTGRGSTGSVYSRQYPAQQVQTAMAGKLHHVLARKAVGRAEDCSHGFVQLFAVFIADDAEVSGVAFGFD